MEGLTIEKINELQAENDRLRRELKRRDDMLMNAHFQNKKISEELMTAQTQYNKVVEQNKQLQQKIKGMDNDTRDE